MVNPEVYNDEVLMSDWYNYRTRNVVSHNKIYLKKTVDKSITKV